MLMLANKAVRRITFRALVLPVAALALAIHWAPFSFAQSDWQAEWNRVLEAARKEGRVVAGIPASAELRKALETGFGERYKGIALEMIPGSGSTVARRIMDEYKAGVRNFDVFISGAPTPLGLVSTGALEPVEPFMILPEVKDPRHWWGGHVWGDNKTTKRFIYSFQAYMPVLIWYNEKLLKPEEIRSYDDLLHPKWKGRLGFLDPRIPGGGQAIWAYMRMVKGEPFLKKLAEQDILVSDSQRQLPETLAKGNLALTLGLSYYQYLPFLKAGLPVKSLPIPKEGINATTGSGAVTIIRNSPHPNGAKLFVNWLLGKEGQEAFGKAMGQPTRRLDVDTKWMEEVGARAAKDFLSVEDYYKRQIDLEDKLTTVWDPAGELAKKLFK